MKFQNFFRLFLNGRTDTGTDGWTHGRTSRNQYAPRFFKVGGIKIVEMPRLYCKPLSPTSRKLSHPSEKLA